MNPSEIEVLNQIAKQAHVIMNQMIHNANHRGDGEKGDPKVGGHPSASASVLHILGALHLVVKSGYDGMVNKPHASPVDHAYNYLLNLFLDKDLKPLSLKSRKQALNNFRACSKPGDYAFQSYHSAYDPDYHNFLPSGTVGIPPVVLGYLALAYRLAVLQGYEVPPAAHFWAVMGDSEFREGSLMEALPDLAEREVGNLTWIVDYNRQSLDGHRLVNEDLMQGCDSLRIEKTLQANGWEVIQVRHGSFRKKLFQKREGKNFKAFLETGLKDIEFQNLLFKEDKELKSILLQKSGLKKFAGSLSAKDLKKALWDLGGHDFSSLIAAFRESKKNKQKPCLVIAHTIKGWGLKMAGVAGNHSALVSPKEMQTLKGGKADFALFEKGSAEDVFLKTRENELYRQIVSQHQIKKKNLLSREDFFKTLPASFGVDFQKMSYPHTQWFLGQVTAKMARLAAASPDKPSGENTGLKACADLVFTMSPDVGTSTNLGACMHHRVFGPEFNKEGFLDLEDPKSPVLWTESQKNHRFLRFEIAEANSISCMAALGKLGDILGVLLLPVLTIYDFFIKRALDQFFYALYLRSGFILCGTPSGVSLSSEGAQHCWKSDFQIPGQISWEPCFLQEMDWVLADAFQRHFTQNNQDRSGVLIRATTKGMDQKLFIKCLKTQKKFKKEGSVLLCPEGYSLNGAQEENHQASVSESEVLTHVRRDVLKGAYYLLHYTGYADYREGDNVVHILAMGACGGGAVEASRALLNQGIYANVIMVTSPDLLLGNLAYKEGYQHLKHGLALDGSLAPLVSVHDGEPGLLDNAGSVLGLHQECLAVRKHSLCGSVKDVYAYHKIDADSIKKACLKVLGEADRLSSPKQHP